MRKDSIGKVWQVAYFRDLQVNEYFQNDGTLWRKRSSRTAVIVRPECRAGSWFYFSQGEVVERQYSPIVA